MTTKTAPGRGDTGRLPPGYFDKPEFDCINCGRLYADEVDRSALRTGYTRWRTYEG